MFFNRKLKIKLSVFVTFFLLFFIKQAQAAQCLDVFPSAYNQATTNSEKLSNIPNNTSNVDLVNGTTLNRGDNFYKDSLVTSLGEIYIAPITTTETTARLYIRGNVTWDDVKINEFGQPHELIIVTNGTLTISGDQTVINAIIYTQGNLTVTGNGLINGALASVGLGSGSANYDENDIKSADFNGMCDEVFSVVANYQFDDCRYSGSAYEVIDQTGNYNATPHNNVNIGTGGQIEDFLYFSHEDHYVSTWVPVPDSFTLSSWIKKPTDTTGNRYFVLGALNNSSELFALDRDSNWRWGFVDKFATPLLGSYSFASLDANWHHIAIVYSGNAAQLYLDGSLVDIIYGIPSGNLQYIGTSTFEFGTADPQGFRAPVDEFIIFDSALNASQVNTVYTNQLAGNNYDGTSRVLTVCQDAIALYRFEQNDFSSQITDTSGNNNHGQNISGVSTANGKYCRGFDSGGYNYTNTIANAFRAGVDPNDMGTQGTISFWFNSQVNWNVGYERVLFDASNYVSAGHSNNNIFALEIQQDGRLMLVVEDSANGYFAIQEPTLINRYANTWYYVTVTWDYSFDSFSLYVDGSLLDNQTHNTNGALAEFQPFVFGDNASDYTQIGYYVGASPYSSQGRFDEVRIYDKVLSQAEIQADMADDIGCPPTFDHFELNTLTSQALTCEAKTINIKACADSFCSTTYPDPISVNLFVDGVFEQAVNVVGDTNVSFSHTTEEVVTLSLDNTYSCLNGSPGLCDVSFVDVMFRFLYGTTGTEENIDNQVAGVEFDLRLQAVENNNGVCSGALNGNKSVFIAQENLDPSGTSGLTFSIDNVNNTPVELSKYPTMTSSVNLNFGGDSIATLPDALYKDAGEIKLHASYSSGGLSLSGDSEPFYVRPHHFNISAINSANNGLYETTYYGTEVQTAGVAFDLTITAVNLAGNTTVNFTGKNAEVALQRTGPTDGDGGVNGTLTGNNLSLSSTSTVNNYTVKDAIPFTNGVYESLSDNLDATKGTKYSEVGLVTLFVRELQTINPDNSSDHATGEQAIGRFIPDHFELNVVQNGSLTSYCDNTPLTPHEIPFAYVGQISADPSNSGGVIRYKDIPEFTITAKSQGGSTTKNYTGDFMKLIDTKIDRIIPTTDFSVDGSESPARKLALTANLGDILTADLQANEVGGVITYSFSNYDSFIYTHESNAKINTFDSDINLAFASISDEDGVIANDADGDFDGGDPSNAGDTVLTLEPNSVKVRFGRISLANSYGPETEALAQELKVEYFEDDDFLLSDDDNCTLYNSNNISFGTKNEPGLLESEIDAASGEFNNALELPNGLTRAIMLPAPGANNTGVVDVIYQVDDWLKYDWSATNAFDENPTAVATFGRFRGNDRIIYWREVFK